MPWEPCSYELEKGKFFYGEKKEDGGNVKTYNHIDTRCPLSFFEYDYIQQSINHGQRHALDQRCVDICGSSADMVDMLLLVSAWAKAQALSGIVGL